MLDHNPLSYTSIERLRREFARIRSMTTYQRVNEIASDRKADHWLHYQPLTPFQLSNYDAQTDDDCETDDSHITLDALTADHTPAARSTRRSAVHYKQFRVIKRPTEGLAIAQALNPPDTSSVIRIEPVELRWCILCKCRHPLDQFIRHPVPDFNRHTPIEYMRHKRYLHHWSYACRSKLLAGFHGRRWRIAC